MGGELGQSCNILDPGRKMCFVYWILGHKNAVTFICFCGELSLNYVFLLTRTHTIPFLSASSSFNPVPPKRTQMTSGCWKNIAPQFLSEKPLLLQTLGSASPWCFSNHKLLRRVKQFLHSARFTVLSENISVLFFTCLLLHPKFHLGMLTSHWAEEWENPETLTRIAKLLWYSPFCAPYIWYVYSFWLWIKSSV